VSTALTIWRTEHPERFATDLQINDTVYRRLDPEYYAWLRSRMELLRDAATAGGIDPVQFEQIRLRFNDVHEWAVSHFGESGLLQTMRQFRIRGYQPPKVQPEILRRNQRGRSALRRQVSPEAAALVAACREEALALGWKLESLHAPDAPELHPHHSLASCLRPGDRIGEVARQWIEIIGAPPGEIRQRFYNPDVAQPWIVRKKTERNPRITPRPQVLVDEGSFQASSAKRTAWTAPSSRTIRETGLS